MTRTVTDHIVGVAVGRFGPVAAHTTWTYRSADPYALHIDLTDLSTAASREDHGPVGWTFSRELLLAALDGRMLGIEHLSDLWFERSGNDLHLHLSSPDGQATITFQACDAQRFAVRTRALVRVGAESSHLDIDAALARLMGGARW